MIIKVSFKIITTNYSKSILEGEFGQFVKELDNSSEMFNFKVKELKEKKVKK